MTKRQLKKTIGKQLEQLETILEEIHQTGIDSEEEDLWDYDYYSDLAENLKSALTLLQGEEGLLNHLLDWETLREEEED